MKKNFYHRLLKAYANIWARRHCKVMLWGQEKLEGVESTKRIYVVSHPTTWDLPLLFHISRDPFGIVVASDPFESPLVNWLFTGCGFLKLTKDNGDEIVQEAARRIEGGQHFVYSLKGEGVDFGEQVRPRTGAIRIALAAGADIWPVHLMIEKDAMKFKYLKRKGESFPFTVFHNTFYHVSFLPPLRHEDFSAGAGDYEGCKKIAYAIEADFAKRQAEIEADMEVRKDFFDAIPRRGGLAKPLVM